MDNVSNVIYVDTVQWQTLIELKRSISFFEKDFKYQRSLEKKQQQFHSLLHDICIANNDALGELVHH